MNIDVNNITLNYNKRGKGNPVILLHGNGENKSIFDKLADKLKEHYTVYCIDSRNHGGSSKTNDYSYETMAEDIRCFIEKLQLTNVSLIGFSDGAIIGLLLALQPNNILVKLVLLGVNLHPSDFKKSIYNHILQEYKENKDPLIKLMLEQPNIDLRKLKNVNIPTLVIGGENDIFYRKVFRDVANTIPDSQLMILKGHDHSSYITNEDILYPDLLAFLT